MTDALVKNLKNSGFGVTSCGPVIEEVEAAKNSSSAILIFCGSFIYESTDLLVYLKDMSAGEGKVLCVIGYEKEIEAIRSSIPDMLISKTFPRPFDMRSITEELESAIAEGSEKKRELHILLVDDDPSFLKMMQGWLSMKYRVTPVNSGMQAITYLAAHTPDLILLDYDMPITSGVQVLEMIKSAPHTEKIPVIFLTGRSDRESVTDALRLKPDGYLLKTMGKEEIVASVDNFFITKIWKEMTP